MYFNNYRHDREKSSRQNNNKYNFITESYTTNCQTKIETQKHALKPQNSTSCCLKHICKPTL